MEHLGFFGYTAFLGIGGTDAVFPCSSSFKDDNSDGNVTTDCGDLEEDMTRMAAKSRDTFVSASQET